MTVIEILKRSEYYYHPTEAEWEEIWNTARENDMLIDNEFINNLYSQWSNKGHLSPKQMYHLIRNLYPEQRVSLRD